MGADCESKGLQITWLLLLIVKMISLHHDMNHARINSKEVSHHWNYPVCVF